MNPSDEVRVMTAVRFPRSLADCVRRFAGDQQGVSAVEFALLLPLMITLYLGGVEISQAVSADRKVTLVARTAGDLVAQATSVSTSNMNDIFSAATAVLVPFGATNLKVTISNVIVDANSKATITTSTGGWSNTYQGTARSGDVTSSIPSALLVANSCLVWAEASYTYKPPIGYAVVGTLNLKDQMFMRPRLVTYTAGANACVTHT
jgi:Flp pilus assembly protein TadG